MIAPEVVASVESLLAATIRAGTPLLLAALGELYAERSGVLNLSLEGMMSMGAFTGFYVAYLTGNPFLAALSAALAALLLSSIHAFLSISLRADQIVSGLALAIFGLGLSGFLGRPYTGFTIKTIQPIRVPWLGDVPILRAFFCQDAIVYASYVLVPLLWFVLFKTTVGLKIRSVGESPETVDALGVNVYAIRYACVLFGGFLAGLAGAYLTLACTPKWTEGLVAGRGWIALALVIVAVWNPAYTILGAYLFGGLSVLYFRLGGLGFSPYLLQTIPYIATIALLTLMSAKVGWTRAPSALTKPYIRGER